MDDIINENSSDPFVLDLGLGVVGGVGRLDVQGDRLSWRGDDDSEDDDDNDDIITELL